MTIRATALFCEDIREEVGGTATVVGIVPDNAGIKRFPITLPKLGIYVRVSMPSDTERPRPMTIVLRHADGNEVNLADFTEDFVRETCATTRGQGSPLATFIATTIASPFPVLSEGRLLVLLRIVGGEEMVIGGMNFALAEGHQPQI